MRNLIKQIKRLLELPDRLDKFEKNDIVTINRNLLGSIDLSQARFRKEYSEDEVRHRNASIAAIFEDIIKPDIEDLINSQIDFMARTADGESQYIFSRGSINGFDLLLEHYKLMTSEHANTLKPETFDKNKVIAELTQ